METARLILEFGALGVLLVVLYGLFRLLWTFAPPFLSAWTSLTATLAKLGEQVENFGVMMGGMVLKVDAAKAAAERSGGYPPVPNPTRPEVAPPSARHPGTFPPA